MKYIMKRAKISFLMAFAVLVTILSSCNKKYDIPVLDPNPVQLPTPTLATLLDDPTFSIFKAAVVKAGLLATLQNTSNRYTLFIPNDAAMTAAGLTLAAINVTPAATVTQIVSYHILPQQLNSTSITNTFPNFAYPTIFNPLPAASPLLRLTTHPSNRNGFWLNNVPMVQLDIPAVNGVAHRIALPTIPPGRYIWDRLTSDADFSLYRAAVLRGDSGVAATSSASIQWVLSNLGPNVTLFAPSNQAMRNGLNLLSGGALGTAAADAVYIGFMNANVPPASIKGIVVYHLLGQGRTFLNNFPTTATAYPTLLNGAIPAHPGVILKVTFTGPTTITSATVKGAGAANAIASNVIINPTPDPSGTSDQHYINGTIQKIDQMLFPQ